MKNPKLIVLFVATIISFSCNILAQSVSVLGSDDTKERGFYDRPYKRYEAEEGRCNTTGTILPASFLETQIQSEATNQVATNLINKDSYVEWTNDVAADGLDIRFSIPDNATGDGTTGVVALYVNDIFVQNITLNSRWAWQYFTASNSASKDPVNLPTNGCFARMFFDELHLKLANKIPAGATFKIQKVDDNTIPYTIDFVELEPVPPIVPIPSGAAVYSGDGSDLNSFVSLNAGNTIYLPAGIYNIGSEIYFGTDNTTLQGAGMWYTQVNFTGTTNGGLRANANNIGFADLYLSTENETRPNSYKALNGGYGPGSTIKNLWAEHFECGGWIANYNGPLTTNGLSIVYCRFRNNFADGTNLCMGTSNTVVQHCSYRNNGDDDMGSWSANNQECAFNTFCYNTAENNWRASSIGFFGGNQNKAHHCVVIDPVEAGIRANSDFAGSPFNPSGYSEFSDISIYHGGTTADLWDNRTGAIDVHTGVQYNVINIKFTDIDVINSKKDAIYIFDTTNGVNSINNIYFSGININGTGAEYPYNYYQSYGNYKGNGIYVGATARGAVNYCQTTFANIATENVINESDDQLDLIACVPVAPAKVISINSYQGTIKITNANIGNTYSIYNTIGRKIYSSTIKSDSEYINSLASGIYIVSIEGTKISGTVVVE